jgi:FkbM family methyltransferase
MTLQPVNLDAYLARPSEPERRIRRLLAGRRHPVILDVGACEGEDSIRYARRFPGGRILAFEPLPANQRLIRENFRRYGASRAELVPIALSDRTGTARFHVSQGRPPELFSGAEWNYGNKSSSLLAPASADPMHGWIEFSETIEVACDTLDRVCAAQGIGRVDFLHLDVQGAELLVLTGGAATLPRTTALWLEVTDRELYAGQPLRPQIEAFLRGRGFALVYEDRREIEGDQFYVNRRSLRAWGYRARLRLGATARQARRGVGRILRGAGGILGRRHPS